jgi:hypothetical protein
MYATLTKPLYTLKDADLAFCQHTCMSWLQYTNLQEDE